MAYKDKDARAQYTARLRQNPKWVAAERERQHQRYLRRKSDSRYKERHRRNVAEYKRKHRDQVRRWNREQYWRMQGFSFQEANRLALEDHKDYWIGPSVSIPEVYPYAQRETVLPEIVATVNQAVPFTLPPEVRAEACQELLLSLLSGSLSPGRVGEGTELAIKAAFRNLWGETWHPISLEDDAETSKSPLRDRIIAGASQCPDCGGPLLHSDGCEICGWRCGWSYCD